MSNEEKKLDLTSIIAMPIPEDQYYKESYTKTQIYLHHTVSGEGVIGDVNWWTQTKERVATCVIVDRSGKIYQAFSSGYWAHHLGIKQTEFTKFGIPNINEKLNKESIGIEIDSWGGLVKKNGKWYNASDKPMDESKVVEYPKGYKGYYAFEKYTDEQIEAVRQLLVYWGNRFRINLTYKGDEIFNLNEKALSGVNGVWTHTSVRSDKSDCHPQIELVNMLKSLK